MLAGPYLALFANLTDIETSMHVLDRLIFLNMEAIQSIVQHVIVQMKPKILNHCMLDKFDSIFDYLYNWTKCSDLNKY